MKHRFLKQFFSHQSGSVLMLFGLSFLFLVGIAGAGYDLGRQQLVRQKLQQASDAAALAGAGMILGSTPAQRTTEAMRYFQLNYPSTYLGVARPTPTITVNANDIRVDASANVVTNFVTNLGVNTMVSAGKSSAIFKKGYNRLDVILVLDNSGSMASTDVGAGNSTNASAGIRTVCINGWIDYYAYFGAVLSNADANTFCNIYEGNTGRTRMKALRYSANQMTDLFMNPNPNDNQMAIVTWDMILMNTLNFTNDPTPVKAFLGRMYGRGATDSSQGMAQAQAIATTGFRSGSIHAVVMMTDGFNYVGGPEPDPAVNAATLAICNNFKAAGTLVYTIGFGAQLSGASAGAAVSRQFLSDCATGPNGATKPNLNTYYFVTPDAVALNNAFTAIAGQLQDLRILN